MSERSALVYSTKWDDGRENMDFSQRAAEMDPTDPRQVIEFTQDLREEYVYGDEGNPWQTVFDAGKPSREEYEEAVYSVIGRERVERLLEMGMPVLEMEQPFVLAGAANLAKKMDGALDQIAERTGWAGSSELDAASGIKSAATQALYHTLSGRGETWEKERMLTGIQDNAERMIRDAEQHTAEQSVLRFNPGERVAAERPDHRMTDSQMLEHVISVRDAVAELTGADGPTREVTSDALRAAYTGVGLQAEWDARGKGGGEAGEQATESAQELATHIGREVYVEFQLLTEDGADPESMASHVRSMTGLHNAYQALSQSGAAEILEAAGGAQDSGTIGDMLQQAEGAVSDLRGKSEEDPGNAETLALLEIAERELESVTEHTTAELMEEWERDGHDLSSKRRGLGMARLANALDDMMRRERHDPTG